MRRSYLKFLCLAPFLMAIDCEPEQLGPQYAFNISKVTISPQSTYSINDTIWISGRVSSNAYDLTTSDSIFGIEPQSDRLGLFKLMASDGISNSFDAVDHFELIKDNSTYSFIQACENADIIVRPSLEQEESFYSYRLGLKTLYPGDYVISVIDGQLQNMNRHDTIIEAYPIPNLPNAIGFNRCGRTSWVYLSQTEDEFYFSIN